MNEEIRVAIADAIRIEKEKLATILDSTLAYREESVSATRLVEAVQEWVNS